MLTAFRWYLIYLIAAARQTKKNIREDMRWLNFGSGWQCKEHIEPNVRFPMQNIRAEISKWVSEWTNNYKNQQICIIQVPLLSRVRLGRQHFRCAINFTQSCKPFDYCNPHTFICMMPNATHVHHLDAHLHVNEVHLICVPNEFNARNRFNCSQCLIDVVMLFFCIIIRTQTYRNHFVWPTLGSHALLVDGCL